MPERTKGKLRPSLPRLSDVPTAPDSEVDRAAGRTADGRFAPSHGLSYSKGWARYFREQLGAHLEGGAGDLGRKAHRLYRALRAELPCVTVGIRSLLTDRARASVLADFYAQLGTRAGPHTNKGRELLAESLKWSARAERLSVTIWDLSVRAARAAAAERPTYDLEAVFEAAAKPRETP